MSEVMELRRVAARLASSLREVEAEPESLAAWSRAYDALLAWRAIEVSVQCATCGRLIPESAVFEGIDDMGCFAVFHGEPLVCGPVFSHG